MLSGDEKLDVMGCNSGIYTTALASEALKPLDDLLAEYGQGIVDAEGEAQLEQGQVDGVQYGIPVMCDTAVGYGTFGMRTDILEKYNIDVSDVHSYDDMTEVFKIVHENEPDMTVIAPTTVGYSPMQYCVEWDKLGDYFGVLEDHGQTTTVTNLFESDAYRNYLDVMHNWYESGYFSKDVTTATEAGSSLMKGGNLFCYFNANKPGIKTQEENSCGLDLTFVQVLDTFTQTSNNWQWTIPENCEYPEKAMELWNLLYSDKEVATMAAYGIEGVNYEWVEEGSVVKIPDGVKDTYTTYEWAWPNLNILPVFEGKDPAVRQELEEFNDSAARATSLGFVLDTSTIMNEITACNNVKQKYETPLQWGALDPEEAIPEFIEELEAAGLRTIHEEAQRQLDEYLAKQK